MFLIQPEKRTNILERRAGIVRGIRRFFDERGFVEVETAVRIAAPAPEEHIDCPVVADGATAHGGTPPRIDGIRGVSFLRASPELQMKKLLASGMDRIYQIGPCFREGERGSRHSQEFTMLEWYRRGATYVEVKEDLRRLYSELAGREVQFRDVAVRDAYLEHAGWDPWAEWDQDRFDFDMATKVEPAVREMGGGVFLVDYPPQAASLARVSADAETGLLRAERWEFYVDGMELANCFTELCDGDEQARRFEAARGNRRALGESEYPLDEAFLDVLPAICSASGAALGVDRLVMVLTGEKEISAVRAKI